MFDDDKEILVDFVTESNEAIEKTELVLLNLEESLAAGSEIDSGQINTIFRTFHSIKGSAGFIGLKATNAITHEAETLLDLIRKDKVNIKKKHIDIFLEVCDFLQTMMEHLQDNFTEDGYGGDTDDLTGRINAMISEAEKPSGQAKKKSTSQAKAPKKEEKKATTASDTKEKAKSDQDVLDALITPEMKKQFVLDSGDLLDSLEQDLLSLEKEPQQTELIESAFRSLHSLKGNAGFFNYNDINQICHKAETFLDLARNGKVTADSKQISMILQVLDFIRIAIDNLSNGEEPSIMGKNGLLDLMDDVFGLETVEEDQSDDAELMELQEEELQVEDAGDIMNEEPESNNVAEDKENSGRESAKPVVSGSTRKSEAMKTVVSEVIRVDVKKLNQLMDLVGEIVISESMVSHSPDLKGLQLEIFEKSINYLQKNIRELQELATSMRMIPLSGLFGKMKRLIRDLSAKNNKKIELEIAGGETEVDRSVLEHISDPLVHMLRNSADHGIEAAELRKKSGKNTTGLIKLEARQVGGEIWITVEDDGAGLNREKILSKAIEKGIVNENEPEMPDEKVWQLIFAPGFSTAAKVSDISGRGVGMDVVVRNVEKIRGRVEVASQPGKGTTVTLRIPLTTAIVDGMLMRVENSLYAIPTLDIKESLQVNSNHVVDLIDGQEVIRVRESLIPVLRLHELHNLSFEPKPLSSGIVVVTEKGGQNIGFLVDEILGQQQLVIKALPSYLSAIRGVSGCAILGDGEICLILDLGNLAKMVEETAMENKFNS